MLYRIVKNKGVKMWGCWLLRLCSVASTPLSNQSKCAKRCSVGCFDFAQQPIDLLHEYKNNPQPPTPSPNFGRRGVKFQVPLPNLGEGFRVRVLDSCNKSNTVIPLTSLFIDSVFSLTQLLLENNFNRAKRMSCELPIY
jgi:hypothetical protein